jgi:hypothetical protein
MKSNLAAGCAEQYVESFGQVSNGETLGLPIFSAINGAVWLTRLARILDRTHGTGLSSADILLVAARALPLVPRGAGGFFKSQGK